MIQLSSAGKRYGHKLLFEGPRLADHAARPRRAGGRQRHRQIHPAEDSGRHGDARLWPRQPSQGHHAGYLPQDGLALSGRTVFAECMSVFSDLREMEKEMEDADRAACPSSTMPRRNMPRSPTATSGWSTNSRTRDGYALEAQVGTVLSGLGFPQGGLDPADRGVLRRLADAHCAGQAAAAASRTCCCWTSRPTTSISKRATGWKSISATIPTLLC